jgi:hypothetical protein
MEEPSKKKKKLSAKETKKSIDAIGKKIEVRLKTLSHFMFLSIDNTCARNDGRPIFAETR